MSEHAPGGPSPEAGDPIAAAAQMSRRLNEYVDVWERALARLVDADYHAEDLIDDWFSLWGKWVRDITAATALTWSSATAEADARAREEP